MARFLKSRHKAKGAAPGSLIFLGKQKMDNSSIRLFTYNKEKINEKSYTTIEKAFNDIKPDQINWLNIDGLHDIALIDKIKTHFKISGLALENVLNTGQRAKYFEDKNSLTLVTKAVYYDRELNNISVEQISFIICENTIISFQEKKGDHFESVRDRIRNDIGKIRDSSADYLLFSLVDCLVDHYLIIAEQMGLNIEELEKEITEAKKETSNTLFKYKTELSYFRKTIRPLKEVMTRILRSSHKIITKENLIYFQELSDLVEHAYESVDTYYTMIGDQVNMYHTYVSNKANDVMKVLTIFASIFIPLTFIAGIYGTNFEYVPELQYHYSYFFMWGVMVAVALVMLAFFKKNKWF
ncbi:MAG: magnesium/cobalt transporter CorA [Salinivirgaceae bacterium]|nr:magnesium/cobalt transporter CorA [Salinivirgaceae bacterium]